MPRDTPKGTIPDFSKHASAEPIPEATREEREAIRGEFEALWMCGGYHSKPSVHLDADGEIFAKGSHSGDLSGVRRRSGDEIPDEWGPICKICLREWRKERDRDE